MVHHLIQHHAHVRGLRRLQHGFGMARDLHLRPDAGDPAVFDHALAQLRCLGLRRVSYVGDAVMDARAAAGAGLDFVAVTTGMDDAGAFGDVPVADDISGVAQLLQP